MNLLILSKLASVYTAARPFHRKRCSPQGLLSRLLALPSPEVYSWHLTFSFFPLLFLPPAFLSPGRTRGLLGIALFLNYFGVQTVPGSVSRILYELACDMLPSFFLNLCPAFSQKLFQGHFVRRCPCPERAISPRSSVLLRGEGTRVCSLLLRVSASVRHTHLHTQYTCAHR